MPQIDRQYNGQKKKEKRTNTTQETKDWAAGTLQKMWWTPVLRTSLLRRYRSEQHNTELKTWRHIIGRHEQHEPINHMMTKRK